MASKHISVTGIVQGVGFRPFVYGLAARHHLNGWVCNTSAGVEIHVEGRAPGVQRFVRSLSSETPPLARIESVQVSDAPAQRSSLFEIRESRAVQEAFQPIPADVAICPDCERELFDADDRRYLYPFINCTNCGPRFTIIKDMPYDRLQTTMADFIMCRNCRTEYVDPLDRRFHAQPIACPECGPVVELRQIRSPLPAPDPRHSDSAGRIAAILQARRLLREGHIIAVKGLGGFHLACNAADPLAVEELRRRKGRVEKPFAVMAADLRVIETVCDIRAGERGLLTGREKPIVLLDKKRSKPPVRNEPSSSICDGVAPGLDSLGVMLPYTPLHHLLLNQIDPVLAREPAPPMLVMTSGNLCDEPIATDNEVALQRLSPLADAFLLHDRGIHARCDDSVVRLDERKTKVRNGAHPDDGNNACSPIFLRRSRGYAPQPVSLPFEVRPTLAVGGELKNTFCLARDHLAFPSQYIGDIENAETYESFEQSVRNFSNLFRVRPEIIAHDLHPGYFTTRYAKRSRVPQVAVQHHHAHIASCMADNGLKNRRLIGLAFDGTGYGTDGATWGGEVLLASYADFERFAHLEYLPLTGGDSAIRHPWRIMVGYARALGLEIDDLPFLEKMDARAVRIVQQQVDRNVNAPYTSSLGRLFDAVASLIGVRSDVSYEAQAAIEMEARSAPFIASARAYPYLIEEISSPERGNGPLPVSALPPYPQSTIGAAIRLKEFLGAVVRDVRNQESAGMIGARFHHTVAAIAVDVSKRARAAADLNEVALSGGVWQNRILLNLVCDGLRREGFLVYFHRRTPANDGGLALGQAAVANHTAAALRMAVGPSTRDQRRRLQGKP